MKLVKVEHIKVERKKGRKPRLKRSGDIQKPSGVSKQLNKKIDRFEKNQKQMKKQLKIKKAQQRKKKMRKLGKSWDKRAASITANINDYLK